MYKQAFLYTLKDIAKKNTFNNNISFPVLGKGNRSDDKNAKPLAKVDEFVPAPLTVAEMMRMEPIELSPSKNEVAYALRNAMSRGSGANLKLQVFKAHDGASATDSTNFIRYNPTNTPIALHEYGHVIDKPNMIAEFGLNALNPALGSIYRYKQEVDANTKGLEAFRQGVAHNKALGDEMGRAHGMISDKALATYRSALTPKAIGGVGGSLAGGLLGYYTAPEDAGFLNKSIRTLGGAWLGGQLGGVVGSMAAVPGNTKATNDVMKTLYSKEYADTVNNLNKNLLADARANNYYRPTVVAKTV